MKAVEKLFETWKPRWSILRAKAELVATKVLEKYKHLDGTYISKTQVTGGVMMAEYNNQKDRKVAQ